MAHASEGEIVTHAEINNLSALTLVTVERIKTFLRIQKEKLITSRTLRSARRWLQLFYLNLPFYLMRIPSVYFAQQIRKEFLLVPARNQKKKSRNSIMQIQKLVVLPREQTEWFISHLNFKLSKHSFCWFKNC